MKTFHLEILSPERAFYQGECQSLVVPTADGSVGILAHRAPLTAAITDGEVSFVRDDGTRIVCCVSRGMVDVSEEDVKVLCESVLLPEEIDEAKAREEMEEALQELRRSKSEKDYRITRLAILSAVNKLRTKNRNAEKINS